MVIQSSNNDSDRNIMSLSAHSIQGRRTHMEDFYDVRYQLKPAHQCVSNEWPYEYFFIGIFDGHGGSDASFYARAHLCSNITKQPDFWSKNEEDVMRAIRIGFARTHSDMRKEMYSWARKRAIPSTAGTTASIIIIKDGKYFTGHVGDSRILVAREDKDTKQWIGCCLTEDHKPESEKETSRINKSGGAVLTKLDVHRVVWKRPIIDPEIEKEDSFPFDLKKYNEYASYPISESKVKNYVEIPFLAIARSLGDFWSINPYSGQYIVSPEPDVSCLPIQANDKGIILATDGLWNVIDSRLTTRCLQELNIARTGKRQFHEDMYFNIDNFYDLAGHEEADHFAKSLVYLAYQKWERRKLRSDNITVVVAMLHDILSPKSNKGLRTYPTRASISSNMNSLSFDSMEKLKPKPVQLQYTKSFREQIYANRPPKFMVGDNLWMEDKEFLQFEDMLLLPPTLLEREKRPQCKKIIFPKNYNRLSIASCRMIHSCDPCDDSLIYIKRVSDDPADEKETPSYTNARGKQVRDSSCQATQNLHDFGQPWNQLLGENDEDTLSDEEEYGSDMYADDDEEDSRIFLDIVEIDDDGFQDMLDCSPSQSENVEFREEDEEEDEDESDSDPDSDSSHERLTKLHKEAIRGDSRRAGRELDNLNNSLQMNLRSRSKLNITSSTSDKQNLNNNNIKNNNHDTSRSSMPQLRCLMNQSPPIRRSLRNASHSDKVKRKTTTTSAPVSKAKRRRLSIQ